MDAFTQALTWLARRELSERQVRDRLARRGHDPDAIDEAVARLIRERALDDTRVAVAYARTAARLKGRGPERVRREVEALGIPRERAREAVDEAYADVDEGALLERALTKRWPRTGEPPDARGLQRIYQSLLRQGFSTDRILRAIDARRTGRDDS